MHSLSYVLACATTCFTLVSSHIVITYPGWRGDNLKTSGTVNNDNHTIPTGAMGINWDNETESYTYPYGMQWMYPCGGMGTALNRTKWPVKGGAVSVQPGWFPGHSNAIFYINLGLGTEPLNMSHPMVPMFQISGPSNTMYKGEFCLPQVPLPANITVNVGDNATIQVIETAQHGAALYSCVDITFADPEDVEPVTEENCRNSTEPEKKITFNTVYTSPNEVSAARSLSATTVTSVVPLLAAFAVAFSWL